MTDDVVDWAESRAIALSRQVKHVEWLESAASDVSAEEVVYLVMILERLAAREPRRGYLEVASIIAARDDVAVEDALIEFYGRYELRVVFDRLFESLSLYDRAEVAGLAAVEIAKRCERGDSLSNDSRRDVTDACIHIIQNTEILAAGARCLSALVACDCIDADGCEVLRTRLAELIDVHDEYASEWQEMLSELCLECHEAAPVAVP